MSDNRETEINIKLSKAAKAIYDGIKRGRKNAYVSEAIEEKAAKEQGKVFTPEQYGIINDIDERLKEVEKCVKKLK